MATTQGARVCGFSSDTAAWFLVANIEQNQHLFELHHGGAFIGALAPYHYTLWSTLRRLVEEAKFCVGFQSCRSLSVPAHGLPEFSPSRAAYLMSV
jgi:hypothetical protein